MKQYVTACIDGSTLSKPICQWTSWVAHRLHMPVSLLHVLEKTESTGALDLSGSIGLDARYELLDELVKLDEQRARLLQEHGKTLLDAAKTVMQASKPDLEIQTCLRHGELAETLQELEASLRLVVIGRQGEETQTLLSQVGSQLESVVRILHTPILVALEDFTPPQRVMFAYDGSETSQRALERIVKSPLFSQMQCNLVMVNSSESELDAAKSMLHMADIEVQGFLLSGDIVPALLDHIRDYEIDLVVMGAYGHSRIRQFLLGSHTSQMLAQSPVPLLLLR